VPDARSQVEQILRQTVYIRGANRPFGELTLDDARARADELRAATGWGPTARVAPVALAWRELTMVIELAPKLWIVPPGGSLL
jgi:hypothetical protein